MHNCRTTREHVTELLLSGVETSPAELTTCEQCRVEYESLKETLRLTKRVIETTAPPSNSWGDYNSKLQQKLANVTTAASLPNQPSWFETAWIFVRRFLTTSIRVPVPVGIAAMLLFAGALGLALKKSEKTVSSERVTVVEVPVQVPVIQEKVVTRIIYRRSNPQRSSQSALPKPDDSSIARTQSSPPSLSEFKPLDEVKFKIIKGGSPDEK